MMIDSHSVNLSHQDNSFGSLHVVSTCPLCSLCLHMWFIQWLCQVCRIILLNGVGHSRSEKVTCQGHRVRCCGQVLVMLHLSAREENHSPF